MKTCPFCAEEIRESAIRCRWCHADLAPRGARGWPIVLGAALGLGAVALLGAASPSAGYGRTFSGAPFARVSDERCPAGASSLPPGHPPVCDVTPRLPPGHPPISGLLPPGHPPIDGGTAGALPPGHPPLRSGPPATVQPAPLAATEHGNRTYDL